MPTNPVDRKGDSYIKPKLIAYTPKYPITDSWNKSSRLGDAQLRMVFGISKKGRPVTKIIWQFNVGGRDMFAMVPNGTLIELYELRSAMYDFQKKEVTHGLFITNKKYWERYFPHIKLPHYIYKPLPLPKQLNRQ